MAEFEDEAPGNLSSTEFLQDNSKKFDDQNFGSEDPSQIAKPSDQGMKQSNPFTTQQDSSPDHVPEHDLANLTSHQQEDHIRVANEHGSFEQSHDNYDDEAPAHFHADSQHSFHQDDNLDGHHFLQTDNFRDGNFVLAGDGGRGDEAEDAAQGRIDLNPFSRDLINQENEESSVSYPACDEPSNVYNPFINYEEQHNEEEEENKQNKEEGEQNKEMEEEDKQNKEKDEEDERNKENEDEDEQNKDEEEDDHSNDSQEQNDHFHEHTSGRHFEPDDKEQTGEMEMRAPYDLLDEEEDDADIQMEPVENIQQPPEMFDEERAHIVDERYDFDHNCSVGSKNELSHMRKSEICIESEIQEDELISLKEPDRKNVGGYPVSADTDVSDERQFQTTENSGTLTANENSDKREAYQEEDKEELEDRFPGDDLESLKQGFPEDDGMEEEEEAAEPALESSSGCEHQFDENREHHRVPDVELDRQNEDEGIAKNENEGRLDEQNQPTENKEMQFKEDEEIDNNAERFNNVDSFKNYQQTGDPKMEQGEQAELINRSESTIPEYEEEKLNDEGLEQIEDEAEQMEEEIQESANNGGVEMFQQPHADVVESKNFEHSQHINNEERDRCVDDERLEYFQESMTEESYEQKFEDDEDVKRFEEKEQDIHNEYLEREKEHQQTRYEEIENQQAAIKDQETTGDTFGGVRHQVNDVEQSFATQGGPLRERLRFDEAEMEIAGKRSEKISSSHVNSDIMSSEYEDRSFVDNLSELTSPETIPQPLPSPPEPKDISPFDLLTPGQETDPGAVTLTNNTADIFAGARVEGETKFGLDGSAVTSTTQNNSALHSDYDEEEEDGSQNLDLGGFTATGTTETETSLDGEFGGRGSEPADNALMSMSMEGSFYDDGGELIGGEDRRNQQQSHLYEDGYITEESSQHDGCDPKQESLVVNPDDFGQKVLNDLGRDQGTYNHQQDIKKARCKNDDFDPLHNAAAPVISTVNGVHDGHHSDLNSLMDAPVEVQGLQTPVSVPAGTVNGLEENSAEHVSESFIKQEHEKVSKGRTEISDQGKSGITAEVPAVAGAAEATTMTKTQSTKKSPEKSAGKPIATIITTTTTTKTTKETKTGNEKTVATKKIEMTTSKPSPRKPSDSRPTSVVNTEKKTAKATTSPTQSAETTASSKTMTALPSYAQPITPRKPREGKPASPEEKKKKATSTIRASSATPMAPRPQSIANSSSTTTRTTARSASTASPRITELARPKSSPTKLSNGITSSPGDTNKSPTKKYGIDSRNEGYRPGGGNVKITSKKKEFKATPKVDIKSKSVTTVTKSPQMLVSPKCGEVKSKIGSLEMAAHTPGGGHVKIIHKKMDFTNVSSKIGSKDNMDYKPGGGNVKIENKKFKVEAKSKIGSLENATHKPGGGDKKIEVQKTEWKAQSKIGSLDHVKHKPDGADKQTSPAKNGPTDYSGTLIIGEHGAIENPIRLRTPLFANGGGLFISAEPKNKAELVNGSAADI